jgi:hypothetical protein
MNRAKPAIALLMPFLLGSEGLPEILTALPG